MSSMFESPSEPFGYASGSSLRRASTSSSSSRPLSFSHQPQSTPPLLATTTLPRSRSSRMRLSVQLFQEKHATEFAHLHLDSQRSDMERQRMLAVEQEQLAEARRIGRAKRQTLALANMPRNDQEEDDSSRAGWRPLSLLARRQPSTVPGDLAVKITYDQSDERSAGQPLRQRHSNVTDVVTPTDLKTPDLSSPLPSDVYSPDLALVTPSQAGIALGCASPPLPFETVSQKDKKPKPNRHSSSGENSIQSSTYSWASSFSGETVELRTAAQYVPKVNSASSVDVHVQGTEQGEQEMLDSPERTKRRRKRIVALAHTVRQLEGVGSRDVEDPNFYQILVKAWNERPGIQPREAIWTPPQHAPPPIPPRPDLQEGLARPDPYLAPPAWLAPPSLSPAPSSLPNAVPSPVPSSTLEHCTPVMDETSSTRSYSDQSHTSSNPFRYSYASSLHDLAYEGGLQAGNQLMSEKAWLRTPLFDQGTYFDAHSPSAPFPLGTLQRPPRVPSPELSSASKSSESFAEGACAPSPHPPASRPLRHYKTDISSARAGPELVRSTVPDTAHRVEGAPSPAPTNWGLGFLGNWLREELNDGQDIRGSPVEQERGFQSGEDGTRRECQASQSPARTGSETASSNMALKRKREEDGSSDDDNSNRFNGHGHVIRVKQASSPKTSDLKVADTSDSTSNSMETITIDLVLPAPLPTPEIELIAQQTGKTREEIQPKPTAGCTIAKEYQYSTPCPRQSYSIPSLTSYPHLLEYTVPEPATSTTMTATASITTRQQTMGLGQEQLPVVQGGAPVGAGTGDLQVEVVVDTVEQRGIEGEGSYPSLASSSSRSQPSVKLPQVPPLLHRKPVSSTPTHADLTLMTNADPYQTPVMMSQGTLQPVLPPLPPTPKYRRPTPPFPLQPFIESATRRTDITDTLPLDLQNPHSISHLSHAPNASTGLYTPRTGPNDTPPSASSLMTRHRSYDPYFFRGFTEPEPVTLRDERSPRAALPSVPAAAMLGRDIASMPDMRSHDYPGVTGHSATGMAAPSDLEKGLPSQFVPPTERKSKTPLIFFILGFLCPILWFIGGWPILRPSPTPDIAPNVAPPTGDNNDGRIRTRRGDIESGPEPNIATIPSEKALRIARPTESQQRRKFTWVDHHDPMVRACRWAAIISTPLIVIAGIVAIIVVFVTK
ncbi:hypothetical protein IAU59_002845 [Kwoniella sp. CBS 9459]